MNEHYDSWQASGHASVNCLDRHLQPGFSGYVRGKINGLAQAVDCMVGRVGTKPNANVTDASCLRSECHSVEEITATTNQDVAQRLRNRVEQARAILQSVSADGSWGVHNFKYTEAMLLRAHGLVSEAR